mmetsp:Transcript_28542/g.101070  ORF Transcript_28542/g.101070 Transcript_28542/m.101070 type:complete len:251 (-) Transcript_28542:287-1039(-)
MPNGATTLFCSSARISGRRTPSSRQWSTATPPSSAPACTCKTPPISSSTTVSCPATWQRLAAAPSISLPGSSASPHPRACSPAMPPSRARPCIRTRRRRGREFKASGSATTRLSKGLCTSRWAPTSRLWIWSRLGTRPPSGASPSSGRTRCYFSKTSLRHRMPHTTEASSSSTATAKRPLYASPRKIRASAAAWSAAMRSSCLHPTSASSARLRRHRASSPPPTQTSSWSAASFETPKCNRPAASPRSTA